MQPRLIVVSALLLLTGCSARSVELDSGAGKRSGVITSQEIDAVHSRDVFQLIQRTRPLWLRTRGPVTPGTGSGIAVFRDGVRLGGLEQLRGVPVEGLRQIVHYSGPRATTLFGTGHPQGAIELIYSSYRAAAAFP